MRIIQFSSYFHWFSPQQISPACTRPYQHKTAGSRMSSGGKNVPPGGAYNSGPFQNPQHLRVTQNLPYPATQ